MRITAFLGAGAVVDIGGPTTGALTEAVKSRQQWDGLTPGHQRLPLIKQIADRLDSYWKPSKANFEDILHAIESIVSLKRALEGRVHKAYAPAFGAFVQPKSVEDINPLSLIQASDDLVDEVANHIVTYVEGFRPGAGHQWFSAFWQDAAKKCPLDVATLNYDNCIEQSLGVGICEDGFVSIEPGISRFDPMRIVSSTATRILHLHGSLFYGYPTFSSPDRFHFEDQHEDLYKFDRWDQARKAWFGRSQNEAQSGEKAIAGPIITGQRKADKLLGVPYATYQCVLQHALISNPRLLIAGYSFGDLHFTRLLSRMTRVHGDKRRVVIICCVPSSKRGTNWHPQAWGRRLFGDQTIQPLVQLSRDDRLLMGPYSNPWVSRDERCRIYLEGFKDAIQNHGADIINFLTT